MSDKTEEKKLTGKQKKFADFYLGEANLNGTKAARLAGYEGNDNVLAVTAFRLLRNAKISAYIDERLKGCGMGANEVIATLTAHARGSITDILNEDNELDLDLARERGTDRLIKKIKIKRISKVVSEKNEDGIASDEFETSILHEQIEFEIHDSQAALEKLGKYHKLFTDKTEVEHHGQVAVVRVPAKVSPEEWKQSQSEK
jgi:phage terminase small subunit